MTDREGRPADGARRRDLRHGRERELVRPAGAHERAPRQGEQAALAVSTVIFALRPDPATGRRALWTPLVRRIREPELGRWALPGGWLPAGDGLEQTAARTLRETTGLSPAYLEQLFTFGEPGRSPGRRVVSVVYWALVQSAEAEQARADENVDWFPADHPPELAFDHAEIVEYALWRIRTKLEYARIAHAFLGETFTLAELREVYEAVLQRPLDPANFRRTMEASGQIVETGQRLEGTPHRPPKLYRSVQPGPASAPGMPARATGGRRRRSDDPIEPHPRMRT
ncbi:NUDIX hydrolase [Agromyces archimandritae]|uniref:NUDIX hydrolase n=1 Tax=Agromyces archimandritae TaxID=2781962 RepID=A0A975FLE0_9MICO|nr:NUDIX domain-containing protein [Agromyces archimandritae]QTX04240.1 NUDIX hydrolase [Agromyces archimandritae]